MPAIAELVVQEVHRPDLIRLDWLFQGLGSPPLQTTPGLDPKVGFQRALNPIYTLVIPTCALDVAPSPCVGMASTLFCERLLHDLGLEAFLCEHLLEPAVLVFEFLEAGHQGWRPSRHTWRAHVNYG